MGSRPTIIEVNLANITYNIKQFKRTASNAELMAVVKANAYGHGAIKVAETALKNGATWLGVATVEEGVELREAGFKVPVLILGGILAEEIIDCYNYNLDISVYSKNFLEDVNKYREILSEPLNIHLKIDIGMHRLGILPGQFSEFLDELNEIDYLKIKGIFTHFPDAAGDRNFSIKQIDKFLECTNLAEKKLGEIPYKHTANSAAVINIPQSHFNLVRPGLGLYGYHDDIDLNKIVNLKPAMRMKTKVTSIREIPAGKKVGYGRTYLTERDSIIATLPVGYADGYKRTLSNKGYVLIKGKKAPIAGRICMDQTMIDVTDISGVTEGEEVILIGKQKNEEISIYEVSAWAETIPNDILVSLTDRVNRVYV